MFPWELVFFGVGFLFVIFAFDYGLRERRMEQLMLDIENYLTFVDMEQKEENDGY